VSSKRFRPSRRSSWLVPALIVLLLLVMLSTFAIVALSVLGFKL